MKTTASHLCENIVRHCWS